MRIQWTKRETAYSIVFPAQMNRNLICPEGETVRWIVRNSGTPPYLEVAEGPSRVDSCAHNVRMPAASMEEERSTTSGRASVQDSTKSGCSFVREPAVWHRDSASHTNDLARVRVLLFEHKKNDSFNSSNTGLLFHARFTAGLQSSVEELWRQAYLKMSSLPHIEF